MKTFKQFHEQVSRRGFLKGLFGTAAAVAVGDPVKAASAVSKAASAPWIKVTLEHDFSFYDYKQVAPEVIGTISKAGGTYAPGLSKNGDIMIDYNDSASDMMEVYVKPGTATYKEVFARTDDDSDDDPDWESFEFEKLVFDTISDFDGDGGAWLEKQLENEAADNYLGYEKQPEDWKDEIAMVDGLEDGHYEAAAQMDAADTFKRFIDQATDLGTEIPDHIKDIVGRGYMKAHVLANGSGSEPISNDTMQHLRDLYNDEDIDYPDEMDSDRWLEGEADNPMDSMAYDSESYQRDMDQIQGTGEYEQPPGTGADTSWTDKLGNTLSLQQVLDLAEPFNRATNPRDFEHLLIPTERDQARVDAADVDEPILIAYDGKKPISIIDGQHRLKKALDNDMRFISFVRVDVNQAPQLKQMFDPPPEDQFDKLNDQMEDGYEDRDDQ